jgi:hypothetical protein
MHSTLSPFPSLHLSQLTWVKEHKVLAGEASDFLFDPDTGFDVISHHTGKVVTFIGPTTYRDREGDITHWDYSSTDPSVDLTVRIFND